MNDDNPISNLNTWTREHCYTFSWTTEQPRIFVSQNWPSLFSPFPFLFLPFYFSRAASRLVIDFFFLFYFSLFFFFFFALSEIIWKEIEFSFRNFLRSFEVIKQFVDVIKNFFGNSSFEDLSYSRWRLEKFLEFSCQEFLSDFEMF